MLGPKNLAMSPNHFDYIFVHLRQKARLGLELKGVKHPAGIMGKN